jgi:hypothetical protein
LNSAVLNESPITMYPLNKYNTNNKQHMNDDK